MREVVLDTETTGLSAQEGHRIVEIGCVELSNYIPTGKEWHSYINPNRHSDRGASNVHGLDAEFLAKQPLFQDIAHQMLEFIGDSPIVAHNAEFDMGFLNAEFARAGMPPLSIDRAVDSLEIARKRFPGQPNSLDALLNRFNIDASTRVENHGAIVDARLLARAYLELRGGRQSSLQLEDDGEIQINRLTRDRPVQAPRPHAPTREERLRHAAFVRKHVRNPIWLQYKEFTEEAEDPTDLLR